jgi:hypothetical protein
MYTGTSRLYSYGQNGNAIESGRVHRGIDLNVSKPASKKVAITAISHKQAMSTTSSAALETMYHWLGADTDTDV